MMISVVIPTYNEARYLGKCLESLAKQDYDGRYEIIVVDNGSSDNTTAIANTFGVRAIRQTQRGIAPAREAGFRAAQGEIIASTDADTVLPSNWLSQIESLFNAYPDAVAVAGHYSLYEGPIVVRSAIRFSLLLMPLVLKCFPYIWNFPGSNFAVKAKAFQEVGGFNTALNYYEDVDLCRRLQKLGTVVFSHRLVVSTSGRAFASDPSGLFHLIDYFSYLLVGRSIVRIEPGTLLQSKIKSQIST